MKRVLILIIAISLFLCLTASAFQGGGGEATKNPKPTPKPRPPSAPKPKAGPPKRSSTPTTGVEVTTPSGLKYRDEVVGTGASPRTGQNVTVHYTGTLKNGTRFDSSRDRQPFRFRIGTGSAIRGWDEGLMTMKVGGKRRLIVPPNLGYGAAGRPPTIPPNATLIFEIELLSVTPSTAGIGALPLRSFEFDVVTLNSSGAITNRRKGQSRYYVEQVNGIALELVEVPSGTFLMGGTESEADLVKKQYERFGIRPEVASKSFRQELPQHTVSVSTFYMGKYEVTQAQWRAVSRLPKIKRDLVSDPAYFKGDSLPVEQVSWEDAVEFCARLSRATGRTYRLPTEAEWEYACRGGTTTPFAFGETITPQIVNYDGNYPYAQAAKGAHRAKTTPVGFMRVANGFGLFDMHGNVYEWCLDYWHDNYDGAPTDGTSWETADDYDRRVLRGGAQAYFASDARSASRSFTTQDFRNQGYGFRIVAVVRTR